MQGFQASDMKDKDILTYPIFFGTDKFEGLENIIKQLDVHQCFEIEI